MVAAAELRRVWCAGEDRAIKQVAANCDPRKLVSLPRAHRVHLVLASVLVLFSDGIVGAAAAPNVGVCPRRLGYWRFNSADFRNEQGREPVGFTNVGTAPGIDGLALRIPSSPGAAWLRFSAAGSDGHPSLTPSQGAIRFWYKPSWVSTNLLKMLSSPMGTVRPQRALRLFEIGYLTSSGYKPRMGLSIDAEGTELVLHSVGQDGRSITNFVVGLLWFVGPPSSRGGPYVFDWREIVVNYTATNCSVVVNGALQQDKRNKAWVGPGVSTLPVPASDVVLAIGGSFSGDMTADGLVDELETFDQPIGPLRNYYLVAQSAACASVAADPPKVTLHWIAMDDKPVTIRRRPMGETNWTQLSTNATGMSFVDNSPTLRRGRVYEYEVGKRALSVAIDAAPVEDRGRVIVLVDQTLASRLARPLSDWMSDLVGDGWTVVRHDAPRHDDRAWDNGPINRRYIEDLHRIKLMLVDDYRTDPARTRAVVIVGHVTVPYSGIGAEDGHANMSGAWPADSFYGDMDGNWTDQNVNIQSQNPQLRNVPGDGKFDPNLFDPHLVPSGPSGQGGIEIAVGRIDFARLPAFKPRTEVDLLSQYFAKNHRYRHKSLTFEHGVVAAGRFFSLYHGQSAIIDANAAWLGSRLFGIGTDEVFTGDLFAPPSSCLWGMQGGYGAYDAINNSPDANRALGVQRHSSADIAKPENEPPVGFYLLKGSFFAHWNLLDNCFMRAVLATPNYGLGALFTMDTVWRFEDTAVGEPLAAGLIRTIRGRQSVRTTGFFGDPTLRLAVAAPPANLTARQSGNRVMLAWKPSAESGASYCVYRSTNGLAGPFARITSVPVTTTEFTDLSPPRGRKFYMVRAAHCAITASGSFTNLSQGIFTTAQ